MSRPFRRDVVARACFHITFHSSAGREFSTEPWRFGRHLCRRNVSIIFVRDSFRGGREWRGGKARRGNRRNRLVFFISFYDNDNNRTPSICRQNYLDRRNRAHAVVDDDTAYPPNGRILLLLLLLLFRDGVRLFSAVRVGCLNSVCTFFVHTGERVSMTFLNIVNLRHVNVLSDGRSYARGLMWYSEVNASTYGHETRPLRNFGGRRNEFSRAKVPPPTNERPPSEYRTRIGRSEGGIVAEHNIARVYTRGSVEVDCGLVWFLTAVPLGRAARGTVDQRVPLVGHESGRMVHVQRVEISHAVIRPGCRPFRVVPVVHSVHTDLVVVFAPRRERFRSLYNNIRTNEKQTNAF